MRSGPISSSGPNTLVSTAAYDIPDDIILTFGDDSDIAMLLRSATLTANTALTGVLEGTPVTPALAANSLIIANQTNDGDVLIAASDGGTSYAGFFMDASEGTTDIRAKGAINFMASSDVDDYLTITAVSNVVTLTATGSSFNFVGAAEFDAITLGGAVAGGDQAFTGVGDMTFTDASIIAAIDGGATSLIFKAGGLSGTTFITLNSVSAGTDNMVLGKAYFFDVGGESIESDGTYLTITSTQTKFSGGIVTGGVTPEARIQNYLGGAHTATNALGIVKVLVDGTITAGAGSGTLYTGMNLDAAVTTQNNSETIPIIAQLYLNEPAITKGTDTVTIASTLYITDAPTEGVTNAALYVASGDTNISTLTLRGAVAGGDQAFTGVGDMTFTAGSILKSGSTNTDTLLLAANDTTFITMTTGATDVCTMNAITMSGTWLASGTVTFPAITLGGTLDAGSQSISNVGNISLDDGAGIYCESNDGRVVIRGGDSNGAQIQLWGATSGSPYNMFVQTADADGAAATRLQLSGHLATAVATWSNVTHTGLNITSGQVLQVAGTQVVGARVVNAAIDDAINAGAWDATTAGVLTAIRDAVVTHGLVAAA